MASNEAKMKAFEDALKIINKDKRFQSETGTLIAKLGDKPVNVETISTGSLVLNSILGGGIPKGRIVEIYGAESSGKTTIALTVAAHVQSQGGTVAFLDFENALDPRYAKKLGVDVSNLALSQPDFAEQGLDLIDELASSGAVDLIIVDSVAALVPKLELENGMDQQSIGLVARLMSRSLKKLIGTANKTKTTVIFINQTRVAIGGFSPVGTPMDTTGGKALKFYASQRVEIKRLEQIKDGKTTIGNKVRLTVRKNKIAPPFLVGETILTFNKGINSAAEMVEVGPDYGVIGRPNNRSYTEGIGGELFASSKADAVAELEKNTELYDRLAVALQGKLAEAIEAGSQPEPVAKPVDGDDDSDGDDE